MTMSLSMVVNCQAIIDNNLQQTVFELASDAVPIPAWFPQFESGFTAPLLEQMSIVKLIDPDPDPTLTRSELLES